MKINDELLFFIIRSRLFAPLSSFFSILCTWEREFSIPFISLSQPHLYSPTSSPACLQEGGCLGLDLEVNQSSSLDCRSRSPWSGTISEIISAFCYGSTKLFCPNCLPWGLSPPFLMVALARKTLETGQQLATLRQSAGLKCLFYYLREGRKKRESS